MKPSAFAFLGICLLFSVNADGVGVSERFKEAVSIEEEGNVDAAIRVYIELFERHPGRADILYRLTTALGKVGKHERAVELLTAHLKRSPRDTSARFRLGEVLFALGRAEKASVEWDRVLDGARTTGPYVMLADRYRKRNQLAQAARVYRLGRTHLKNEKLFSREMAEMAERLGNNLEAVREYIAYAEEKPQYMSLVESRLRQFAEETEERDRIFDFLARKLREHPGDIARLRFSTEFAVAANQLQEALDLLSGLPKKSAASSTYVLRIANAALEQGDFALSVSAYEYLKLNPGIGRLMPRILLGLARAHEGSGNLDAAKEYYRGVSERDRAGRFGSEALFRLGELHARIGEFDEALTVIDTLAKRPRRNTWRLRGLFERAEIWIQLDRVDKAEAAFRGILSERKEGDDADRARLGIAHCRFYSANLDSIEIFLEPVLSGSPARIAMNDALELSSLIEDGKLDGEDVLNAFGEASMFVRQNLPKRALESYRQISAGHPRSNLADRALFSEVELLESLGRFSEVIPVCQRLTESYPWSPLAPGSKMTEARIHEHVGDTAEAVRAYESLLVQYPRSLEADRARERLRALQKMIEPAPKRGETG